MADALTVLALMASIVVWFGAVGRKRRRAENRTDFTRAFDRLGESSAKSATDPVPCLPAGVLLVPDISVWETTGLSRLLEERGIRFEVRQTAIDREFSRFGNGGLRTRMCIIVHPDDAVRAQAIADRYLNPDFKRV